LGFFGLPKNRLTLVDSLLADLLQDVRILCVYKCGSSIMESPRVAMLQFYKSEKSYFTESVGKLKEAATKKADESILIQIANKDLVLKVEYHKQCYEKYMCKRFPQLVFHRPKL
jgi:hypothetical protein